MLKKVMKARDARAADEANPLLVCSFTTFLAEYTTEHSPNLEPALHRCLTSLEYHRMEEPTELGKRNATSLAMLTTKGGKLAVKYNHQKHYVDATQHNLTNRRIEAAADEPAQEDSKEDDGAEDAEAPSAVDEPVPEDAKEEGNAPAEETAQDPDDKADEAVASQC